MQTGTDRVKEEWLRCKRRRHHGRHECRAS